MSEVSDPRMEPELNNPEPVMQPEPGEPARGIDDALASAVMPQGREAGNNGQGELADEGGASDPPADADETVVADQPGGDADAEDGDRVEDGDGAESASQAGAAPEVTTEQVVEAVLFGADMPLTPAKIVAIVGTGSARDVRKHIENLNQRYEQTGACFRIEKIAGGYQMLSLPAFNPWLKRLKQTRQESKLSQAAMETLAVVAYKQPVVRAEIEAIRGVATGEMLNRLRELGLVKIVGRAEDVGRPLLYGTTKRFLDVFGMGSLEDLPTVEELKAPE